MAKNKFTMGGGMPNMNNMLRQAQKMQAEMQRIQAEVEEQTVEASAGGGAVTVKIKGTKEITEIKISPEAFDPDDIETLEDLVLVAVNDAISKASKMMEDGMSSLTGGMNIPGMF